MVTYQSWARDNGNVRQRDNLIEYKKFLGLGVLICHNK